MTVKQLREELSRWPDDAEVFLRYPHHNITQTVSLYRVTCVNTVGAQDMGENYPKESGFAYTRYRVDEDNDDPDTELLVID